MLAPEWGEKEGWARVVVVVKQHLWSLCRGLRRVDVGRALADVGLWGRKLMREGVWDFRRKERRQMCRVAMVNVFQV